MKRYNEIMEWAQALEKVLPGYDGVPRAPFERGSGADFGSCVVVFGMELQIMGARTPTMQVPFLHLTSSRPL